MNVGLYEKGPRRTSCISHYAPILSPPAWYAALIPTDVLPGEIRLTRDDKSEQHVTYHRQCATGLQLSRWKGRSEPPGTRNAIRSPDLASWVLTGRVIYWARIGRRQSFVSRLGSEPPSAEAMHALYRLRGRLARRAAAAEVRTATSSPLLWIIDGGWGVSWCMSLTDALQLRSTCRHVDRRRFPVPNSF